MIWRTTICLLIPIAVLFGIHIFVIHLSTPEFQTFYATKLQGPLFSGFLGLGGFLFALKTFIVIKMKENVYDHANYKALLEQQRKINPKISSYGPLKRLSDLLFYTVICSLFSALIQFTIGFIPYWLASLICSYVAFFTLTLLILSLVEIRSNLNYWFKFLEDAANK
jgi:hypothetical protein